MEYADGQILFTLSDKGIQDMLNFIVVNATPFELRLSQKKGELICHRPRTVDRAALPQIAVGSNTFKWKSFSCISWWPNC